jgi:Uma2 family endonuclease
MIQQAKRHLGPADHGRRMTYDEYLAGDYQEGYKYELIDGELYVSPQPNLPCEMLENWLLRKFLLYSMTHEEITNFVTNKARLFVPGREDLTTPEPDLAVYKNFPKHLPDDELDWRNVSPFLAGEILSADDPNKDLVRNVELFWQIASIKEYWIFDTRLSAALPALLVYRRQPKKWKIIEVAPGEKYTTRLLPGFELIVDRRQ